MRFSALDGLRGCFALLVALFHFNYLGHFYSVPFVRNSYLFVDFFFVLSGFVISSAYGDKLGSTVGLKEFVLRRFGRLWPLHIVVLVAFVIVEALKVVLNRWIPTEVAPFADGVSLRYIFSNVALIHSLGVHPFLTWNGPSWSISVEFYTYILFAVGAMCCYRVKIPLGYLLALAALCGFCMLSLYSRCYMDASYDFGFFRSIYGFSIGCLMYRFLIGTKDAWNRRIDVLRLFELASAALVIAFVSLYGHSWLSLLAPLVFSPVIYVLALESGPVARLLLSGPLQAIGRWSYSIYMVHALVSTCIGRVLRVVGHFAGYQVSELDLADSFGRIVKVALIGGAWTMDGLAAIYLATVVALAALSYRFVEVPARAYFNGLARRQPRPVLVSAARSGASESARRRQRS